MGKLAHVQPVEHDTFNWFVLVDLSHSVNMIQFVPDSLIVLITEVQPNSYKGCLRHSSDG